MGAATVITGVLAQVEEFLDIHVPGLKVGAYRPLALAALIHRHGGVINDFQEGHDALAFAVGALDVGTQRPHRCPVVAQTACKLGQHGVVLDRAVNAKQIVGHGRQITGAQLRPQGTGVKQRRCRAHVVEGRQQPIELDRSRVGVVFPHGKPHRNAHKEDLRQLETHLITVDKVAVIQGLQPEIGELQIPLGFQCFTQHVEVKLGEVRCQQFQLNTALDKRLECLRVIRAHLRLGGAFCHTHEAQAFRAQIIQ